MIKHGKNQASHLLMKRLTRTVWWIECVAFHMGRLVRVRASSDGSGSCSGSSVVCGGWTHA